MFLSPSFSLVCIASTDQSIHRNRMQVSLAALGDGTQFWDVHVSSIIYEVTFFLDLHEKKLQNDKNYFRAQKVL